MDGTAVTEAPLVRLAARELIDFCAGCDGGHGIKPDPGMVLGFCAAVGRCPRAALEAEADPVLPSIADLEAALACRLPGP